MRRKKGFTMIEILFVIIILAAIAALAIPRITKTIQEGREDVCKANMAIINSQIEQYRLNTGSYPANSAALNSLLNNKTYFPEIPRCPFNTGNNFPYTYDSSNDIVNSAGHGAAH